MRRVKPIAHEDQVSLVEHLDELRARIVVSLSVFGVALALCFWQNHLLLELAAGPLPAGHTKLITFGITEPFTTTLTVSAYAAIILSMPILLFQAYAYLLPAFSKQQQRLIIPLLLMIPALFIAGIAFGFFVVLPAATKFLLNFNDTQFNVQVQAKQYYGFFAQTLLACGIVFQIPVGILAVDPPRHRHGQAADQEPPLRLPRLRGDRGGPSRRRPGLDAAGDGAAGRPVRAQHRPRPHLRDPGREDQRAGGAGGLSSSGRPLRTPGGRSGATTPESNRFTSSSSSRTVPRSPSTWTLPSPHTSGIDVHLEFVDQSPFGEDVGELTAAVDEEVPLDLVLQPRDRVLESPL